MHYGFYIPSYFEKAELESPLYVTEFGWIPQPSISLQVIHKSRHSSVIIFTYCIEVQLRIATYKMIKTLAYAAQSMKNMVTFKTYLFLNSTLLLRRGKHLHVIFIVVVVCLWVFWCFLLLLIIFKK